MKRSVTSRALVARKRPAPKSRASVRCCDVRCRVPKGRRCYFDPPWRRKVEALPFEVPETKDAESLAIRCAICLRVFCLVCARRHFRMRSVERAVKQLAAADLSCITGERHGKLVDLVVSLRALLSARTGER